MFAVRQNVEAPVSGFALADVLSPFGIPLLERVAFSLSAEHFIVGPLA